MFNAIIVLIACDLVIKKSNVFIDKAVCTITLHAISIKLQYDLNNAKVGLHFYI